MIVIVEPKGILKKYIKNYHIVETNSSVDFMPRERVFPYGNVVVVFHYGSPSKFQSRNSNGYYDQSHFIHDFKNLIGVVPKVFINDR